MSIRILRLSRMWTSSFLVALALATAGCDSSESERQDVEDDVVLTDGSGDVAVDITLADRTCDRSLCAENEVCCDLVCVDVMANAASCGACGVACLASESCVDGACTCGADVCDSDSVCCDDAGERFCVDPSSDSINCGACGVVCSDSEICVAGVCACATAAGTLETCSTSETCCPGSGCHDLDYDPGHCGVCGQGCGVGELCVNGQCACGDLRSDSPVCAAGEACCGSPATCRPVQDPECDCGTVTCGSGQGCCDVGGSELCISTWRDPNHCGGCGLACGGGAQCLGGVCDCVGGLVDCDGDVGSGCETRLDIDRENCGACRSTCEAGEICDGTGACALTCAAGLTDCNGECVDLSWNRNHCGACDNACAPGEVANGGGECTTSCLSGFTNCDGECVDLSGNRSHCGACGLVCAPGEVCDGAGQCALTCVAGFTECAGNCVELESDRRHCGGCGVACQPGEVCDGSGRCALSCGVGTTNCDGRCVDLTRHREHCGACGVACTNPAAQCVAGACAIQCSDPGLPGVDIRTCSGLCVDIMSNTEHCGACEQACPGAAARCTQGTCSNQCAPGTTDCSGTCADLNTDPGHCGACGQACQGDEMCVSGVCCGSDGCTGPKSLSASTTFACAVTDIGALYCWGTGSDGAMGLGEATSAYDTPQLVEPIDGTTAAAEAVALGSRATCALLDDATVTCWGDGDRDMLGDGTVAGVRLAPNLSRRVERGPSQSLDQVEQIAVWNERACARRVDGTVWCWGSNYSGDGRAAQVPGVYGALDIGGFGGGMCVLLANGGAENRVYCWTWGLLSGPDLSQPVLDDMGAPVDAVELADRGGCFATRDHRILCTGTTTGPTFARALKPGEADFTWVNAVDSSMAIVSANEVLTWGSADSGQLGRCGAVSEQCLYGTDLEMARIRFSDGSTFRASSLSRGLRFSCALGVDGQVWCWGDNERGSLGAGDSSLGNSYQFIPDDPGATLVPHWYLLCTHDPMIGLRCNDLARQGAGLYLHPGTDGLVDIAMLYPGEGCGVDANGALLCWSETPGTPGRECYDTACLAARPPTVFGGIDGVAVSATAVAGGEDHYCVALAGGGASCWGGWTTDSMWDDVFDTTPAAVGNLTEEIIDIAATFHQTCALTVSGAVKCWGNSFDGLLGDGTFVPSGVNAVDVLGIDGVSKSATDLFVGETAACVRLADGTAECWGQIPNVFDYSAGPSPLVEFDGVNDVVKSIGMSAHIVVLLEDGRVFGAGENSSGELGPELARTNFATMDALTSFDGLGAPLDSLVVRQGSTCVQTTQGEVQCVGHTGKGYLGNPNAFRAEPKPVLLP